MSDNHAGLIAGTIAAVGLSVTVLNYWRDRAHVDVFLDWKWNIDSEDEKWATVRVINSGRRIAIIRHIYLLIERNGQTCKMGLTINPLDKKLAEGEYYEHTIENADRAFQAHWKDFRALVLDSRGREHLSPRETGLTWLRRFQRSFSKLRD